MKTLYLECNMGAAGDMLMATLVELLDQPDEFVNEFNNLNIPNIKLIKEESTKCGIVGTHMRVMVNGEEEVSEDVNVQENNDLHEHEHEHTHDNEHDHDHSHGHHSHSSLSHIEEIINGLDIPAKVKKDAVNVYGLIGEAEAKAHNKSIKEIHFHEVGTMDAIADVVGVCMLIDKINPDRIMASPVHVGSGNVRCAHGILPVPAPATAYILREVPSYSGNIKGELCTPTGAALLKYFADDFDAMPIMKTQKIGYGMGNKDFPVANCIRAFLGEEEQKMDDVLELVCNIDDMTAEEIGFATEILMNNGALDVYTTNINMKKNRPGTMITCMCKNIDKEKFLKLIFKYTTTLGVREYICKRYGLTRNVKTIESSLGDISLKESYGYGISKEKLEYEDLARIAKEKNAGNRIKRNKKRNIKGDLIDAYGRWFVVT